MYELFKPQMHLMYEFLARLGGLLRVGERRKNNGFGDNLHLMYEIAEDFSTTMEALYAP